MAIIAALMAVATPTGVNALSQAKATTVAANFRTLQQAVIQMLMFEKTPPTSGEILDYIYANEYISTNPEGFSVYYDDSEKMYVIKYTNSDIDAVKVKNINNSVELDSGDGKMIVKVPKS